MRILLIEDDLKLASFILKGFKEAGFAVDHCTDGEDGLHMALNEPYDAAIVDIMLPKLDGFSLIDELRRRKKTTPVIILSAKRSVEDRIKGLQTGSDDYLVKPFSFAELLARVQALIRRASGAAEPSSLMVGDCVCTNALSVSTVVTSMSSIASTTDANTMLSKLAVGLELSCFAVPSHCSHPSAQACASMDMSHFCFKNAKLSTAFVCCSQVNSFMFASLMTSPLWS